MLLRLAYLIHHKLGDEFGGSPSPPGSGQELKFGELDNGKPVHYATTYNNDGFELWLGGLDRAERPASICREVSAERNKRKCLNNSK
jgi:hypothetical protein